MERINATILKNETHRLGDYIREVNVRNRDLKVTRLLGVGLEKKFFPSIANIIGTDLSNYKVIKKGQFGCKFMSVGRDGILPVSILEDDEPAIISSAYYAFEVNDPNELLPEYLMMWLSRPEFDRELWFYSGGDVRGGVNYEAFCDMPIYFPSIERQREIVSEYETLTRRIRLNEQMIEKLEATAQALYRHTFVDNIDKQNLPQGWHLATLGEVCETQYGYTETATQEKVGPKFLRITDIVNNLDWSKVPYCHISDKDYKKYKLELGDIVVSRTGANIGWAKQIKGDIPDSVFASFLIRIKVKDATLQWLIGYLVESSDFKIFVAANQQGSAQPQANANVLAKYPILIPNKETLQQYNMQIQPINRHVCIIEKENTIINELQSLLLSKMGQ